MAAVASLLIAGGVYLVWDATRDEARPTEPWPDMSDFKLVEGFVPEVRRPTDPTPEPIGPLPIDPPLAAREVARRLASRECGDARFHELRDEEGGMAFVPLCFDARIENGFPAGELDVMVVEAQTPAIYEDGRLVCLVNVKATSTRNLCKPDQYYLPLNP